MFFVEKETMGKKEKIILRNQEGLRAEILPFYGACLNALYLPTRSGQFINVIDGYQSDDEPFTSGAAYKGIVLFPYPNRLKNGEWTWKDKILNFPINEPARNNQLHGFAYNQNFEVVSFDAVSEMASVLLRLKMDNPFPWFPFKFELQIEYILSEFNGLSVVSKIINHGVEEMPFGLGWHPYFKTGSRINDLVFKISALKMLETDIQMIPTGNFLPFRLFESPQTIGETSLDSGFLIENQETFKTQIFDPSSKIKLTIWQEAGEEGYNYVQVYTPPHRQSIAIEPMTCRANALQDLDGGLQWLKPGSSQSFSWGVSI